MKLQNLLICIALAFFQLMSAQNYELQNSIRFNDESELAEGITWNKSAPLSYGIYRTKGPWSSPNYQQLKLVYETGIIMDGGSVFGNSGIFLQPNGGNVGIGTLQPTSSLSVGSKHGIILSIGNPSWENISIIETGNNSNVGDFVDLKVPGSTENKAYIKIVQNGNVGIGTRRPDSKLSVAGTIHSQEVKVDMNNWSDFVFKKEYNLPTLTEVENHIKENGHLKDIPSEEKVLQEGINLGEMNSKLLQKIEEMTLYIIEQNKQIINLEDRLKKIELTSK